MDKNTLLAIASWLDDNGFRLDDVGDLNLSSVAERLDEEFDLAKSTLRRYLSAIAGRNDFADVASEALEEFESEPEPVSVEDLGEDDLSALRVDRDPDHPLVKVRSPHDGVEAVMDFDRRQYRFDFEGEPVFDVPFDDVQRWVQWYTNAGAGLTRAEVCRRSARELDRPLTTSYFTQIKKSLDVTKKSTPHAPHLFVERSVDELVDGWREQDEALVEEKYQAREVGHLRRSFEKLSAKLSQYDDFVRGVVEAAELSEPRIAAPTLPERAGGVESYTPILHLSDWHVGKQVDRPENVFDVDVAWDRIGVLCRRLADHLRAYRRPIDEFVIAVTGDMIDGPLGDMHPQQWRGQDLHGRRQCVEAADLLASVVGFADDLVDAPVCVHAVAGNHGRARKSRKDDPFRLPELLTYEIAKASTTSDTVSWNIHTGKIGRTTVRNTSVILAHGDWTPRKVDAWGATYSGETLLALTGHSHSEQREFFRQQHFVHQTGGCLPGVDDFHAEKIGKHVRPAQGMVHVYDHGPTPGEFFYLDMADTAEKGS